MTITDAPEQHDTRRRGTTRQEVIETTVELIAVHGQDLSMRMVGERLGMQAASLYWYIGSKAELLDAAADLVYARAAQLHHRINANHDTADLIRLRISGYRQYLLNNDQLYTVVAGRTVAGPGFMAFAEPLLRLLDDAGMGSTEAALALGALLAYTHGSVSAQRGPIAQEFQSIDALRQRLQEDYTPRLLAGCATALTSVTYHQRQFQYGLSALLGGITAQA